jgi:NADH:ubiquinone oxidoreductase subunit
MSAITPHVNLEKIKLSSSILDEFAHSEFPDSHVVRVAFRTLGSRKHEHWLNKYAANLTRLPNEKKPAGSLTHAELIFAVRPGVYVKSSVIKKKWVGKDDKGNDIYQVRTVQQKLLSWPKLAQTGPSAIVTP